MPFACKSYPCNAFQTDCTLLVSLLDSIHILMNMYFHWQQCKASYFSHSVILLFIHVHILNLQWLVGKSNWLSLTTSQSFLLLRHHYMKFWSLHESSLLVVDLNYILFKITANSLSMNLHKNVVLKMSENTVFPVVFIRNK